MLSLDSSFDGKLIWCFIHPFEIVTTALENINFPICSDHISNTQQKCFDMSNSFTHNQDSAVQKFF